MSCKFITAIGDANHVRTWSGIPYHLLQSGLGLGVFQGGLKLDCEGLVMQWRRAVWNIGEWGSGRGFGGFQYSDYFLEKIWGKVNTLRSGDTLINLFQLYPPSIGNRKDLRRVFYIDQTLAQLFEQYSEVAHVSFDHRKSAIDAERMQYHSAHSLIAHCKWAADSLIHQYGVPSDRVAVVLPGANIESQCYSEWERERSLQLAAGTLSHKPSTPMRFVFVGRDGHRKGLDRLLAAMNLIPTVQHRMKLTVIGALPDAVATNLRQTNGVTWVGSICKVQQTKGFLKTLGANDVGVLLSRAEAGGIALREFQRVGLAVVGPAVGGAPEMVLGDSGVLIRPNDRAEEIAETIQQLIDGPERVETMKRRAWERRQEMSWDRAVLEMRNLI
jgi:glycosyltransferase involved in cell wall biosynthesis